MKLSTKTRYGVKAMLDIAYNSKDNPISIKCISERQHISESYLEQLFALLRKAKLVKSIRGAQGGYILGKKASEISVWDIMEVLEGPVEISDCLDNSECNNSEVCATRLLWGKIKKSIDDVTKSITLQDMLNDYLSMIHKEE
ncbi:RrF2 family transcriptional regulator [Clostridium grantii]|uniref:Transcriptional regulator, BadM/Rrf2 family n=1 Tax=Clostridium grantii DSM 8605 TaxID=1121316 RepID=A0A1M5QQH0_9CLOT|nr:Rrf2 family transcriptional regulator [Clostridium grantii]SHH16362.1 transcriptional regulator, BadM/Rrf2 family [Clostridium grantii DSM 8605]